jgi:hypothetical protein
VPSACGLWHYVDNLGHYFPLMPSVPVTICILLRLFTM